METLPRVAPTDELLENYLWPRLLVKGTAGDYLSAIMQAYAAGQEVWEFSSNLPYVYRVEYDQMVRVLTEMIENRKITIDSDTVHIERWVR